VVLPDDGSIVVKANLINPDAEITLVPGQTNDSGLAEDYTLKQPIRRAQRDRLKRSEAKPQPNNKGKQSWQQ
jgi:hypothetical protein